MIYLVMLLCCDLIGNEAHSIQREKIEIIVKQWAPLVWLAPHEKYMPSNIEDFLDNMNFADERGSILTRAHPFNFLYYNSKDSFLLPIKSLEELKANQSSFLHGKNPEQYNSVPIYAVVTYCDKCRDASKFFYVTYWMFYPYNEGKDTCFLGELPTPLIFNKCLGHYRKLGNHIGDWEHMSISFSRNLHPKRIFLSVHDAGAYYAYDKKTNTFKFEGKLPRESLVQVNKYPKFIRIQDGHPVVFAAKGSHGLWSSPGEHEFIRVPRIWDKTGYGIPWKTWTSIELHHLSNTHLPYWLTFMGKWGNPKSGCVLSRRFGLCEYTEGPSGLLRERKILHC